MFTEDETIMNHKQFIMLLLASFSFAACAPGAATPTAEVIPTVIADSTSDRISDVLVQEGTVVKKGEELIRLGDLALSF
jgi:multidrug efflux pump subunit AcrA (membrane-fusion protein)